MKEDEAFYAGSEDKICLCDFSVIAATKSFYGCGDVVLPLFDRIVSPPFNESECIKEIKLDFGPMAKLGVSSESHSILLKVSYHHPPTNNKPKLASKHKNAFIQD